LRHSALSGQAEGAPVRPVEDAPPRRAFLTLT